jgi:hypothetical protein
MAGLRGILLPVASVSLLKELISKYRQCADKSVFPFVGLNMLFVDRTWSIIILK